MKQESRGEKELLEQSKTPLIFVGTATCGRSAGALETLEVFRRELENRNIDAGIIETGCFGLCYAEPVVGIMKPGRAY
jgi:NADH-quinone oxidoreductase subunit F